jgi:thiamine-monophosphate kinase
LGEGDRAGVAKQNVVALDPDKVVPWLASAFKLSGRRDVIAGVADDDCGVIQIGKTIAVLSTDFLNATPIAEQLGICGERGLGRIAVAVTLSDLLGSGAIPHALLVAITVPHGYPEDSFRELMLGARYESNRWNVPIIGGDTKLGSARAILTCGIGTVDSRRELFLASNAKPGDLIFSSGYLGTCAAATCIASQAPVTPRWAQRAIAVPDLPFHRSRALAKLRVAHAGIDVSDGLAADLHRLCKASCVGAVLEVDRIPIHPGVRKVAIRDQVPAWTFSLASGGDFQFIVTVPQRARVKVENLGFTKIGTITRERNLWLQEQGGKIRRELPEVGHKDRQGQRFVDEIRRIVQEANHGYNGA